MKTKVLLSELCEFIIWMPGTWPRWRSNGAATVEAMVEASAPASLACTKIAGNCMSGSADTPSSR